MSSMSASDIPGSGTMTAPADREAFTAAGLAALLAAMVCAVAIHLPAPMSFYYGEPDAAMLVSDALLWVRGGIRTSAVSEYRYYSRPWSSSVSMFHQEVSSNE